MCFPSYFNEREKKEKTGAAEKEVKKIGSGSTITPQIKEREREIITLPSDFI